MVAYPIGLLCVAIWFLGMHWVYYKFKDLIVVNRRTDDKTALKCVDYLKRYGCFDDMSLSEIKIVLHSWVTRDTEPEDEFDEC